jgi:hypothetical protein
MGRTRTIKKEPTTTIEVYLADGMIIDDIQKKGDSKPETVRKMFLEYFGKEVVENKRREIRKKLDRECLLGSESPDQSTLDNMYFPRKEFKDIEYSRRELVEMILQAKPSKDPLAKRNADDSITKAVNKGFLRELDTGMFQVVKMWFKK